MSEINDDNKRPSYFSGVQIGDIVTRKEEPPDNLYLVAKEKIEETFYDGPIRYLTLYSLENGRTTYCLDGEVNVLSGADRFSGANYNYGTRK